MNITTSSHRSIRWQLAFWTAMLLFVLYLLYWQSAGRMRLVSLPGLFLSMGMLCNLSRVFVGQVGLRRSLTVTAFVLFACSLAASLRDIITR
jgi:hypothetical protein